MELDLTDLVLAWLGREIDPARREQLLARLRADEEFRREFVAEIRLYGMLKTVQSPEPRWLSLEDELGWSAEKPADHDSLEERIAVRLDESPRSRGAGWTRWMLAAASILVAFACVAWFWPKRQGPRPVSASAPLAKGDAARAVAMVLKLDQVAWEREVDSQLAEGAVLPGGPLRIKSGRATIAMLNGVTLVVEGPADLDLVSVERIHCRQGKLRTRVPTGAEGFVVSAPGLAIMDVGTDFAMNFTADGQVRGMVYDGEVEVSVLSSSGVPVRSAVFREGKNFEIDTASGGIDAIKGTERFVKASELTAGLLQLAPNYSREVNRSRPWGYWRFETVAQGLVPNEVVGGSPLRAVGPIRGVGSAGGNQSAEFVEGDVDQYFVLGDPWEPVDKTGYAAELWFVSTTIAHATLASLVHPADSNHHSFLLELTSRNHLTLFKPASVRFVHRLPPGRSGGETTFSESFYVPYRWHHVVAQVSDGRMQVFIDGEPSPAVRISKGESPRLGQFLLGRLSTSPEKDPGWNRSFRGRLDEVALYNHALTHDEILRHYQLGRPEGGQPSR